MASVQAEGVKGVAPVTKANGGTNGRSPKREIQNSLAQLDALIRRGKELRELLVRDSTNAAAVSSARL